RSSRLTNVDQLVSTSRPSHGRVVQLVATHSDAIHTVVPSTNAAESRSAAGRRVNGPCQRARRGGQKWCMRINEMMRMDNKCCRREAFSLLCSCIMTKLPRIGVLSLATYVPAPRMSSDELAQRTGIPRAILEEKFGILEKPMPGPEDHPCLMGARA